MAIHNPDGTVTLTKEESESLGIMAVAMTRILDHFESISNILSSWDAYLGKLDNVEMFNILFGGGRAAKVSDQPPH